MSNLKELLQTMKEVIGGNDKVLKSVSMRKEWRKPYQEMLDARAEHDRWGAKANSKKKAFWAMVENDLDCYDKDMRVNDKTDEVEIMAGDDDIAPAKDGKASVGTA